MDAIADIVPDLIPDQVGDGAPGEVNPTHIYGPQQIFWGRPDLGFTPAQWDDQSTDAVDATVFQAVGANQGSLEPTGGPNGLPCVLFESVNSAYMESVSATWGGGAEQLFAYLVGGWATVATFQSIFTLTLGSGHQFRLQIGNNASPPRKFRFGWTNSAGTNEVLTTSAADTAQHIFRFGTDGSFATFEVDGVAATPVAETGTFDLTAGACKVTLGGFANSANSRIADAFLGLGTESAAQKAAMYKYLGRYT